MSAAHSAPKLARVSSIGAHYDMCGEQAGADNNGTGIAALLELARLPGQQPNLPYRVELVAYTLE